MKLYTKKQVLLLMLESYKAGITDMNEWVINADVDIISHTADRLNKILNGEIRESCDSIGFYCQREIEGNAPCDEQCEHCHEYYKPIEGERT